jgi:hypothetical protein
LVHVRITASQGTWLWADSVRSTGQIRKQNKSRKVAGELRSPSALQLTAKHSWRPYCGNLAHETRVVQALRKNKASTTPPTCASSHPRRGWCDKKSWLAESRRPRPRELTPDIVFPHFHRYNATRHTTRAMAIASQRLIGDDLEVVDGSHFTPIIWRWNFSSTFVQTCPLTGCSL